MFCKLHIKCNPAITICIGFQQSSIKKDGRSYDSGLSFHLFVNDIHDVLVVRITSVNILQGLIGKQFRLVEVDVLHRSKTVINIVLNLVVTQDIAIAFITMTEITMLYVKVCNIQQDIQLIFHTDHCTGESTANAKSS